MWRSFAVIDRGSSEITRWKKRNITSILYRPPVTIVNGRPNKRLSIIIMFWASNILFVWVRWCCVSVAKRRAADACWDETSSADDDAQQHTTRLRRFQSFLSTYHAAGQSISPSVSVKECVCDLHLKSATGQRGGGKNPSEIEFNINSII